MIATMARTEESHMPSPTKPQPAIINEQPKYIYTKKEENKITPYTSSKSFDWAESFAWADQTVSRPDFNDMTYKNEFMQYLEDHLELGARITSFSLDETTSPDKTDSSNVTDPADDNNGRYLGTIDTLTAENTSSLKLFVDWMFNPYIGIELTSDEIGARTYTDTDDHHSDGTISMSGPVIYAFGRYPFQINTENYNFIIAPYLGIGFAIFSSDFHEDSWWALGYSSPAQWEQAGSPTSPTGNYARTIDVKDSTGMVIAGGCTIKVYRGVSFDFYMRIIDADTDAVFTRTRTDTGDYEIMNGHFPMKTTGYGFGLRYAF